MARTPAGDGSAVAGCTACPGTTGARPRS